MFHPSIIAPMIYTTTTPACATYLESHTIMEPMQVVKRNASTELVNLNKIVRAITKSAVGLDSVDPMLVATKIVAGLYNGVTTKEIENLAIQVASSLTVEDPQYASLAAVLLSNSVDKTVEGQEISSFSQSVQALHKVGLLGDRVLQEVERNKRKYNSMVVKERTRLFEYFGLKTLVDRYLLKHPQSRQVLETPQYFFLRIAIALSVNPEEAQKLYTSMSSLDYMPSTPTLFNAGCKREQLSSCFLVDSPEDSLEGIYKNYTDIAKLSKFSGGIGVSYSRIRSHGSLIKGTNGPTRGIVPFLKTLDSSVASIDQGSKRKGACAVFLETWHADIEAFLELRDNTGDEASRTYNLNLANWIPDLFMRRVEADQDWSLFDPVVVPNFPDLYGDAFDAAYELAEKNGLAKKTVKARSLYARMIRTLAETGNGWMNFKDRSNKLSNQTLLPQNVIHSSNLCVAPETKILTRNGYFEIANLLNQKVEVWNGSEWSETKIKQTGHNVELVRVVLSNGVSIECTPEHKFATSAGYGSETWELVQAADMKVGTKLFKFDMPVLRFEADDADTSKDILRAAYAHGFFCGDGTYAGARRDQPRTSLYGEKRALVSYLDIDNNARADNFERINIHYRETKLAPKFAVPSEVSVKERLSWFAGLLDSDGTVARNGTNESLQISSINLDFLHDVRLMLTTLGIDAKITKAKDAGKTYLPDGRGGHKYCSTQSVYRLLLSSVDTYNLIQIGLETRRLKLSGVKPQRNARHFTTVVAVEWNERFDDTYCFTEPKKNLGTFNGVVTGQCTEILEVNSSEATSVCNLASVNLSKHCMLVEGKREFDFAKLACTVDAMVRQLDRVIDINYYTIPETERSNLKWRPVGLGLMGLQDVFFLLDLPFDGPEARALSKKISETIYFFALTASNKLAQENGKHEAFAETRMSKGVFQFEGWGVTPSNDFDWSTLRTSIVEHGLRNSLLVAIAPTATIASIVGCYECIEPQTSNLFKRETMSGDFLQINRYLVNLLKSRKLWNDTTRDALKMADGSVQHLDFLTAHEKLVYRTVWEISQKSLIEMAVDRGAFIDQSQSLNLFLESPTIGQVSSMFLFGWKAGLKTSYYLRSRPASKIAKSTVSLASQTSPVAASVTPEPLVAEPVKTYSEDEVIACSIDDPNCEACQLPYLVSA